MKKRLTVELLKAEAQAFARRESMHKGFSDASSNAALISSVSLDLGWARLL